MLLALPTFATLNAQTAARMSSSKPDSVLLSQTREGDYMVKRYLVKHDRQGNSDFAVRYRINLSTLSTNLDGNNKELADLKVFLDTLAKNPHIHVNSVAITGYASPDGVEASNQKLAHARAVTLKNYLDNNYNLSKTYNVQMQSEVENWSACEKALAASRVADRDKALGIIRGRESQADKQRSLKAMPAVWDFLKAEVLPKLRYADVEFAYNRDEIAEVRTLIEKPKPNTGVATVGNNRCCCCGGEVITHTETYIEDLTNGLIVEMDEVDVDFY